MDRVFSFLLWPKREARGPWKQGRKKRGSITCPTDRANEANKMFIIWLCWLFRFWKGDRELEVRMATYGPGIDQSQHAKSVSHIIITIISPRDTHFWRTPEPLFSTRQRHRSKQSIVFHNIPDIAKRKERLTWVWSRLSAPFQFDHSWCFCHEFKRHFFSKQKKQTNPKQRFSVHLASSTKLRPFQ